MQYLHLLLVAIACKEIQNKNQQFLTDDGYEDDDDDNPASLFFLFVLGFFLIIFSAALLWREAITEYRLVNMRDICKIGDCNEIHHELNGELVHMQGQSTTDVIMEDTEFGITLSSCIKLKRHVEQLQFVRIEHKHKKSATTYTYELRWKPEQVCSAGYPSEYQNKPQLWLVKSQDKLNPDVRLGAFTLSESLKQGCQNFQFLVPDDAQLQAASKLYGKEFPHIILNQRDLYLYNQLILYQYNDNNYLQQHEYQKTVGDLRICFEYVLCGNTTVVSKQFNNKVQKLLFIYTFIPYLIQYKYIIIYTKELQKINGYLKRVFIQMKWMKMKVVVVIVVKKWLNQQKQLKNLQNKQIGQEKNNGLRIKYSQWNQVKMLPQHIKPDSQAIYQWQWEYYSCFIQLFGFFHYCLGLVNLQLHYYFLFFQE